MKRRAIALWIGIASTASADPAVHATAQREPRRATLVYGELLGKGGPWGVGVEHRITPRLALGAVASFAVIGEQQLYTAAPYVHATLAERGRWALFGELGAALVHSRVPSPVPMWDGTSDTGGGGIAAAGGELSTGRLAIRLYLAAAYGEGGLAPFLGLACGVRL